MSTLALSKRASATPASPIRKLVPYAQEAKAQGVKVLHLNIGEPDLASPPEFFEGLKSFTQSLLPYELSAGSEQLKSAWSEYTNKSLGVSTRPENFMITTGGSEALLFTFMALTDPGDEALVFEPTYANYLGFASMAGIKLVPVGCRIEDNFRLPPIEHVRAKIGPKTKAIIICSPNNPTGALYSTEEIKALLELCEERNIFLVSDEAYREYVYDGKKFSSALQLGQNNPRLIVIDSMSKRFSLCGARLGAIVSANTELLATSLKFGQARLCSPTLEQFASAYLLKHVSSSYVPNIIAEFEARRNVLWQELNRIPGVVCPKPAGAFFCIAKLPVADADEFAKYMLQTFRYKGQTTFVAPASGFYVTPGLGKSEVRIAYVIKQAELKTAVEILAHGLLAYQELAAA